MEPIICIQAWPRFSLRRGWGAAVARRGQASMDAGGQLPVARLRGIAAGERQVVARQGGLCDGAGGFWHRIRTGHCCSLFQERKGRCSPFLPTPWKCVACQTFLSLESLCEADPGRPEEVQLARADLKHNTPPIKTTPKIRPFFPNEQTNKWMNEWMIWYDYDGYHKINDIIIIIIPVRWI